MVTSPGVFPAAAAAARGEFPGPVPGTMSCKNTGGGRKGSDVHLEKNYWIEGKLDESIAIELRTEIQKWNEKKVKQNKIKIKQDKSKIRYECKKIGINQKIEQGRK